MTERAAERAVSPKIELMAVRALLALKVESYLQGKFSEAELVGLLRDAKKRVSELSQK